MSSATTLAPGLERSTIKVERPEPAPTSKGAIAFQVGYLFRSWMKRTQAPFDLSGDTGFMLGPETERGPDVCLVRKPSRQTMEVVRGSLRGAPDVAAEIVSPGDSATDLDRKVAQYLAAGTSLILVLNSETRHIMVYRRTGEARLLSSGQTVEESELLPGFSAAVDEFFDL